MLETHGYTDVAHIPDLQWQLSRFKKSGKTRTGRGIFTMKHVTPGEANKLAAPVLMELKKRMKSPALQVVQIISAPAGAPMQEVHRDHDLGKNKMFTLVIDRTGNVVSTMFDPASHLEEHCVMYRNNQRVLMEQMRMQRMHACSNKGAVMYDAYVMHAGSPNMSDEESFDRIFISFIDVALDKEELDQLNEISFIKPSFRNYFLL